MMKSYTINFAGSGEVCEGFFESDLQAIHWAQLVFLNRGVTDVVRGDWDADGQDDEGGQCYRLLFWATEEDAEHDCGAKAFAEVCKVGE